MKNKPQLVNVKTAFFRILCLMVALLLWNACSKDSPGGNDPNPGPDPEPYPEAPNTIIALYNLRNLHTGQDVTLTKENMSGAHRLAVVVTSDHSAGNLPDGWLIAQERRHQGILRGITIPLETTEAAKYVPGDSLVIDIEGGILTRINNHLQLTNIQSENIIKIASRRRVSENRLSIETIAANPGIYESTFITTETALGFTPAAVRGDKLSGNKTLVRGSAQLTLATRTDSPLADLAAPITARFSGIISNTANGPILHLRTATDMEVITGFEPVEPEPEPEKLALVISGFMQHPTGGLANDEYIQFLALEDIDFEQTPYAVITTNNAGTVPAPANGWATGSARTYQINITSGKVYKGNYFYVGGNNKRINGEGSSEIPEEKYARALDYNTPGDNNNGNATANLLANCGNPSGIAVFKGTDITVDSEPVDVIFIIHTGGFANVINGDGTQGYKITDTDHYKKENGDFFYMSSTLNNFGVRYAGACSASAEGKFYQLGGVYDVSTQKWTTNRKGVHNDVAFLLPNGATLADIETANSTKMTPAP